MPYKVVVVDDSSFMRMTIKDIIEDTDEFEVVAEGKDGNEAVELYKTIKPDVMTLDITMRGKDGLTALKEIKEYDPNARVIMISSLGEEKYVKKAIDLGAEDFIVKPFDDERLIEALKAVVGAG